MPPPVSTMFPPEGPPAIPQAASSQPLIARNACDQCMRAKRSCDRQLPGCKRCFDKKAECHYSTRRPRRPRRPTGPHRRLAPEAEPDPSALQELFDATTLAKDKTGGFPSSLGIPPPPTPVEVVEISPQSSSLADSRSSETRASNSAVEEQNSAFTSHMPPDVVVLEPEAVLDDLDANDIPGEVNFIPPVALAPEEGPETGAEGETTPWFLGKKTWKIERGWTCIPSTVFRSYLKGVQAWLEQWARQGYNVFIHKQLYRTGLPPCLQDAYTTLVTYLAMDEKTEDMIMQIVENRMAFLIYQQSTLDEVAGPLEIRAHLSRVQALFVYVTICLFDGYPNHRLQAEQTFPLLSQWCRELLDTTIRTGMSLCKPSSSGLAAHILDAPSMFDPPIADTDMCAWRLWILTESIRRTWLVTSSTVGIYLTLRDGWADCTGANIFTARNGLWDAETAKTWAQLARSADPLFFEYRHGYALVSKVLPSDVDTFAMQMLRLLCEASVFEDWKAKGKEKEQGTSAAG